MPLYTYYCKQCTKAFEIQIKLAVSDNPVKCPHCKRKLEKIITPVRFKFV